jgi:hypothetical protein
MRNLMPYLAGALLGILAGSIFWWLVLGMQVQRHEPGLWTLRTRRVLPCGLDYNGPPWTGPLWTARGMAVWLTCGDESRGWRLWPPEW